VAVVSAGADNLESTTSLPLVRVLTHAERDITQRGVALRADNHELPVLIRLERGLLSHLRSDAGTSAGVGH
jgi:hypothetical protein